MWGNRDTTKANAYGFVYGLDGIMNLFGVSKQTALRLKKGVLKPAVRQRGAIIITDVAKALELFDEGNENNENN